MISAADHQVLGPYGAPTSVRKLCATVDYRGVPVGGRELRKSDVKIYGPEAVEHFRDLFRYEQAMRAKYKCAGTQAFGPISAAIAPATPTTIITSVVFKQWTRLDLGNTIATNGNLVDQSSGGNSWTQATAGSRPAQTATDASLNNRPTMTADGVDDFLLCAGMNLSNPIYIWWIGRQNAWTAGVCFFGQNVQAANAMVVQQQLATPQLRQNSGTAANVNASATIAGTPIWFRGATLFNAGGGGVNDYLKIIANKVNTTASAGANSAANGFRWFSANNSNFISASSAEQFITIGAPNSTEDANMDVYTTALYGAGKV